MLAIYGFLAASSVLGIEGVSVLLVHLGLSFSVAQLRKPALSWACNLLLLSTFHVQPLQEIQVGFRKGVKQTVIHVTQKKKKENLICELASVKYGLLDICKVKYTESKKSVKT